MLGENDLHGEVKDICAHPMDYLEHMLTSVEWLHDDYKRNILPKIHTVVGKQNASYEIQPGSSSKLAALDGFVNSTEILLASNLLVP